MSYELNASVALKIARSGAEHWPHPASGPLFGFPETPDSVKISHVFSFPTNNNHHNQNEEGFSFRSNVNLDFQERTLQEMNKAKIGAQFSGWYLCSQGGRFITQSVLETMLQFHNQRAKSLDRQPELVLVVHETSKARQGLVSFKAYILSPQLIQTSQMREKFITKNLRTAELTFSNLLKEVPLTVRNLSLVGGALDGLIPDDVSTESERILALGNSTQGDLNNIEQLLETVDHFNHNQGNFHYYQRLLSREQQRISQWVSKREQENAATLKRNPNATESELLRTDSYEWCKHFKLPTEPSRLENLVLSGQIDAFCEGLINSADIEIAKSIGVQNRLFN
ncbi:hypothetical protein LJB42_003978 [Komagataella kurtzmanii]|nr:hypothetical protein LJB42_003978 [Komagataella kurtzmanii]